MAGESAHFGLRNRAATPAIRPFELPPRLQADGERAIGMAEPFRGIAADRARVGAVLDRKTGVSLAPLTEAARTFLATLRPDSGAPPPSQSATRRGGSGRNIHPWLMRHGVCLADLGHDQREAALALMRETMSDGGLPTARDVMRLNEHALEITGKPEEYSEWFYWVSIFGEPSPDEPWGWQIDGHHLNLNCFVLGDQLVLTPTFMGSEPVLARFGKYAGTRVFAAEEEQGHALMRALSRGGTRARDDRQGPALRNC